MEAVLEVFDRYNLKNTAKIFKREVIKDPQRQNIFESISEEQLLGVMRKALVNKEKRKLREESKKFRFDCKPLKKSKQTDFNKEETESIMEKLMNKIVANPKLINDDTKL